MRLSCLSSGFLLLATTLSAASGGCGGDGSGGSGGGSGGSGSGGSGAPSACFDYAKFDGTTPVTTFEADVLPIFRDSCSAAKLCHGDETGPLGRPYLGPPSAAGDATEQQIQTIFEQIVDVPADKEPGMKIIAPGDPENSFLPYKLDGATCEKLACAAKAACGAEMPLPSAERDIIRRWIAQGAKND